MRQALSKVRTVQRQSLLQDGDRGSGVVPDDLVQAADPEQRPGLAADITERLVQPGGALAHRAARPG